MQLQFVLIFAFSITINFLSAQQTLDKTIQHDGLTRAYTVYIPAAVDGSTAVPLLFKFHGYGMSAKDMFFLGDMRPIADTAGFILVYPQGSIDDDGGTHWNVAGPNSKSDADDLGFTNAMLDELIVDYNIDPKRVYACGYSNGGFFSFDLPCKMSDRIAAVGSVAGTMLADSYNDCNTTHPTPVITIHGTNDGVVSYDGFPGWSFSMDQVNDFWIERNNTATTPTVVQMPDLNSADGSTVEYFSWSDGDACTSVEHYKVNGGDHTWPDINGTPSKTNVDISASHLIWEFVSKHDIDGLIGCASTSVRPFGQMSKIQVFPNPTADILNLKNTPPEAHLTLSSLSGNVLLSQNAVGNQLDLRQMHLPKGMYFLTISTKVGREVFKIIVQN